MKDGRGRVGAWARVRVGAGIPQHMHVHAYASGNVSSGRPRASKSIISIMSASAPSYVRGRTDQPCGLLAQAWQRLRTLSQPRHTPSTLSLLTALPSGDTSTTSAAAIAVPRHRIFDAQHLDPHVLLLVLREWVGADRHPSVDAHATDRTAISLALVDARFFTSLYHHYHVRRPISVDVLQRTWRRRVRHMTATLLQRSSSSSSHRDHVSSFSVFSSPAIVWFIPRFTLATGDASAWSTASRQCPAWLLDLIDDRQLAFSLGIIIAPRKTLPVTSLSQSNPDCSAVAKWLEHLPHLTSLRLRSCRTDVADRFRAVPRSATDHAASRLLQSEQRWVRVLAGALHRVPHLQSLALQKAEISVDGCRALAESLLRHTVHLASLNLSANSIGADGLRAVAVALRHVPDLTAVDLRSCSVGKDECDGAWAEFAASLKHVPQLTSLAIVDNIMSGESARALADALIRLPCLVRLDGTSLMRDDDGMSLRSERPLSIVERMFVFARLLPSATPLLSLDLSDIETDTVCELATCLPRVPRLTTLRICNRSLQANVEENAWCNLASALQHVPQLTELDLCGHAIGCHAAHCFAAAIREHLPRIAMVNDVRAASVVVGTASLDFADARHIGAVGLSFVGLLFERQSRECQLEGQFECQLTHVSHAMSSVTSLDLSRCLFGTSGGGGVLATLLPHVPHLTSLNVAENYMDEADSSSLFAALHHVPQLACLNLRCNCIGHQGCRALADAHVPSLTQLNLEENRLAVDDCRVIAEVLLPRVPRLTSLELSYNYVRDAGCTALARGLEHVPLLALLGFGWNEIGDEGCRALVAALYRVPQLTRLGVCGGPMGRDGAVLLAASLRQVSFVTELNLSGASVGEQGCRAIATAFRHTPQLRSLDVSHNAIKSEGCRALATALRYVPQLRSLNVSRNAIRSVGCCALATALGQVPQLTSLDVAENEVGDAGFVALAVSLRHVRMLRTLKVGYNPESKIGRRAVLVCVNRMNVVGVT